MSGDEELSAVDELAARIAHPDETERPGDEFLRDAGIGVPCAEQFGFVGWDVVVPSILSTCDRPYGHTGAHMARGFGLTGGRKPSDDERTNAVLRQIAERPRGAR